MAVQRNNQEMIDILSTYFMKRWEPSVSWGNVVGTHLMLPHLRGFWPYSSINESSNPLDISANGRTLTNTNAVTFGIDPTLANSAIFVRSSSQRLIRANEAGLQITGSLTAGGWFKPTTVPALGSGLQYNMMSKSGAAGNRGWRFYFYEEGRVRIEVSDNGTTVYNNGAFEPDDPYTVYKLAAGSWHHIVIRYDAATTNRAIFVNGHAAYFNGAGPAALFNSTAQFQIGAANSADHYDGRAALNFVCASALGDDVVWSLFNASCALFGVRPPGFVNSGSFG